MESLKSLTENGFKSDFSMKNITTEGSYTCAQLHIPTLVWRGLEDVVDSGAESSFDKLGKAVWARLIVQRNMNTTFGWVR